AAPGQWMADFEGQYPRGSLRLVLAGEGNFRFVSQVAHHAQPWTFAIDRSQTDNPRAERNDVFPPGTIARYVRVRFAHVPQGLRANLCEVEIYGILSVR